jgi:hypothetical protein
LITTSISKADVQINQLLLGFLSLNDDNLMSFVFMELFFSKRHKLSKAVLIPFIGFANVELLFVFLKRSLVFSKRPLGSNLSLDPLLLKLFGGLLTRYWRSFKFLRFHLFSLAS